MGESMREKKLLLIMNIMMLILIGCTGKEVNKSKVVEKADNYISWQLDNGGWHKNLDNERMWDGKESKGWVDSDGTILGTIDNNTTYTHIRAIAIAYHETREERYKKSVNRGVDFLLKMQYPSGGFPQVYPARKGSHYSNYVTFNDDAMIGALSELDSMKKKDYPYNSDIISEEKRERIDESVERGIDYILKSQIVSQGRLKAWCAQHDQITYEPRGGRTYELPSVSGNESVGIVLFLMDQEQTPQVEKAVYSAVKWFREAAVKDMKYIRRDPEEKYFVKSTGGYIWYRFYELDSNEPIFAGRDGVKRKSLSDIPKERRDGYSWAGTWGSKLLKAYDMREKEKGNEL